MKLAACASLPLKPLTGVWYRALQPQFWPTALATKQTRIVPSRFNQGASANPQFEILYLAENQLVALFEVQALLGTSLAGGPIPNPRQAWIVINVKVRLQSVADLTDVPIAQAPLATTAQELTGDWLGYQQRGLLTSIAQPTGAAPTQELGAALFAAPGLEGFETLSAKLPHLRNLVVFPQNMRQGSFVEFSHPATGQKHVINGTK